MKNWTADMDVITDTKVLTHTNRWGVQLWLRITQHRHCFILMLVKLKKKMHANEKLQLRK